MRLFTAGLAGLFFSATLLGCGGATIPQPPADAKPGPPPGTDQMIKAQADAKAQAKTKTSKKK